MLKHWISAFRLRTLPLALSTILMGNALAINHQLFSYKVFVLSIIVTVLLQILSNLANDYGDGVKGTDNDERLGPTRAIQSGAISQKQMRMAIFVFVALSLFFGLWLVFVALSNSVMAITFILIGIGAIGAAIKYTVGSKAYGYNGLGDLFVFIFFGLVGVLGTFYLQSHQFLLINILPAIAIGCFSTAVLNLNNMRDIENDKKSNKNTLVVKMGLDNAKKYHYALFFWAYLALSVFLYLDSTIQAKLYLIVVSSLVFLIHFNHMMKIEKAQDYRQFDPQLKIVALSSFLLSLLWFVLINVI